MGAQPIKHSNFAKGKRMYEDRVVNNAPGSVRSKNKIFSKSKIKTIKIGTKITKGIINDLINIEQSRPSQR